MTTSSTTPSGLTALLGSLTSSSAANSSTSTAGPLITTGQINVSQLVSELMTIQSQPLTQLQAQEAGVKSKLSAYGQEQSALSALQSSAMTLALPSAFQAASAKVNGSGVSAVVTGTPLNANYSVVVTNVAQAQSNASAPQTNATTVVSDTNGAAAGTITITQGANSYSVAIDATNDTLNGIASAINGATGGAVNASVVTNGNGTAQLVLASSNTGAANAFTVSAGPNANTPNTAATSALTTMVASMATPTQLALDASFQVNGLPLTSASNSVTTAINGVTLNLAQGGTTSQVQVATDPTAVTASVNSFISAYNSLVTLTNSLTNYDATSNTASVLTGDSTTRNIVGSLQSLMNAKWDPQGNHAISYLAQLGVSVNTDGTLTLNASQFQAALSANPAAVAGLFTGVGGTSGTLGLASQVGNAAQAMLNSTGALGAVQQNLQAQVTYMNGQQTIMQAQLAQTQASLTQEYSALNAQISAAQAQQTSLAGQLAALPG